MRIGILSSSNGSTFQAIRACLEQAGIHHEYLVLTDRPCGIETYASEQDLTSTRIEGSSNEELSVRASELASKFGCDLVFLYYSRLVTRHLFESVPTFNVHPSLLPAFGGFHALERCLEERPESFGCTIHRVDASVDGGEIILQVRQSMPGSPTLGILSHFSYLQKVAAGICFLECLRTERIPPARFDFGHFIPGASPEVSDAWSSLLEGEVHQ